jgi:hypothetical protein
MLCLLPTISWASPRPLDVTVDDPSITILENRSYIDTRMKEIDVFIDFDTDDLSCQSRLEKILTRRLRDGALFEAILWQGSCFHAKRGRDHRVDGVRPLVLITDRL